MQEYNPYAPPMHDPLAIGSLSQVAEAGCWRDGDAAVVRRPVADLPDRCVRCNQAAGGFRLERKHSFYHPLLYVVLVLSPLIYVIVALIMRKTAIVRIGLCPDHRARRRKGILVGWIGSVFAMAGCSAGIVADSPEAMLAGLGSFMIFPVVGIVMAHAIQPKRIDDNFAWLKVGKPFLDSLQSARGG